MSDAVSLLRRNYSLNLVRVYAPYSVRTDGSGYIEISIPATTVLSV